MPMNIGSWAYKSRRLICVRPTGWVPLGRMPITPTESSDDQMLGTGVHGVWGHSSADPASIAAMINLDGRADHSEDLNPPNELPRADARGHGVWRHSTADPTSSTTLTDSNGRANRSEDLNPPDDWLVRHLQRVIEAQEVIGERHIEMMKSSSEAYEFEKTKWNLMLARVEAENGILKGHNA